MKKRMVLFLLSVATSAGPSIECQADTLQSWFDANGYTINVATDELGIEKLEPGSYDVLVLDGEHTYPNPTGWYVSQNETHLLFGPSPPGGSTASLVAEQEFGFYIDSYDGTFWTETALNGDGFDHALVFENTKGSGYIVAFEDLWGGGDQDYTDRIILVTPAIALRGSVYVTTGWWIFSERHALPYVEVALVQQNGQYHLTLNADENGEFEFADPGIPAGSYKLSCALQCKPDWATGDSELLKVMHDDSDVGVMSKNPFQIDFASPSPAPRDIEFGDPNYDVIGLTGTNADRIEDLAMGYHYAAGMWRFVHDVLEPQDPNVPSLDLPLEIRMFSPDPNNYRAWYTPSDNEVRLSVDYSRYASAPQPVRDVIRHECFHYLMDATIEDGAYHGHYEGTPPRLVWDDQNHQGFHNHCTGDSWVEGYAEYYPCVVKASLNEGNPHRFSIFGSLERQWEADDDHDEEFAVAALLWDLTDGKGENNEDNIRVTFERLWRLVGRPPVDQSADNEIDVKDLYDALVRDTPNGLVGEDNVEADGDPDGTQIAAADIDDIFVAHRIYADLNDNGTRDAGEEVGRAADQGRPNRRIPHPLHEGAFVRILVIDGQGAEINEGIIRIHERYDPPWQEYDDVEERRLPAGGLVYLHPGPKRFNPSLTLSVQDPLRNESDSIQFSMKDYRAMVERAQGPYVIVHEFELGAVAKTIQGDAFADPLGSDPQWFSAYVELEPNELPEEIDLTQVELAYAKGNKLDDPVPAASDPALPFVQNRITTDNDNDGVLELAVKFLRDPVADALEPLEQLMSVTLRWEDSTGNRHEGTAFFPGPKTGDVTDCVQENFGGMRFNRRTGIATYEVSLTNISASSVAVPLVVVVEEILPATVTVANADGLTADGKPYFDYSEAIASDEEFVPGQTSESRTWEVHNPTRARFTYSLRVWSGGTP